MEATVRKTRRKKGPFKCEVLFCEAIFKRSNDLKRHLQSHRNEKNFACTHPDCDKTFTRRSTLNEHLARHISPRKTRTKTLSAMQKHICKTCAKKYTRSHDLKRHERKHTGEKPFACYFPNCNKTFKRAYNAKVHMRNQHGAAKKFECHDCGQKYGKKFDLVKHVKKHLN